MKSLKKLQQGFTLVEIMIVVAIIGLLVAIAIPNFIKSRDTARRNLCINNLRLIDHAKEQWAIENDATADQTPLQGALEEYMRGEKWPKCKDGGEYTIGNVGTKPTCSITGHELPDDD